MNEDDYSDVEVFETEKPKKQPKPPKPTKEEKEAKKRQISAEHKARLLENLRRGRETSLRNRQKKAEAKKAIKRKERQVIDNLVKDELKDDKYSALEKQVKELQERLNQPRNIDPPKMTIKKDVEEVKVKSESAPEITNKQLYEMLLKINQPKPTPIVEKPKPKVETPKPVKQPVQQVKQPEPIVKPVPVVQPVQPPQSRKLIKSFWD